MLSLLACSLLAILEMFFISNAYPKSEPVYPEELFVVYNALTALVVVFYAICILIGIYRMKRDRRAGIGADVEPDEAEIPSDNA